MDSRTLTLVAVLRETRRKWSEIRADLEDGLTPHDILSREVESDLFEDRIGDALAKASTDIAEWRSRGIFVASPFTVSYPSQLRSVHDYPPLLFSKGQFRRSDEDSIAIVGTRSPSDGALSFIRHLVPLVAAEGISVVSGLARGVDTAAMTSSIAAGNRTVGIIGTGLGRSYPAENASLQARIAEEHLLLSQFWPDAPPTKQTFPMRNHVMSAFASMTLIVEASERSGTRIQARAATRHARPLMITESVRRSTEWGKDLLAQGFDVTVVRTPAEAMSAILSIRARQSESASWRQQSLTFAG